MPKVSKSDSVTKNYEKLAGSERPHAKTSGKIGSSSEDEIVTVSLILRRRPDGKPLPDFAYYQATPPSRREQLSRDEFAAVHGAHEDELALVEKFARAHKLKIADSHPGRRCVVVRGTARQINQAFHVQLNYYHSFRGRYRGFDGPAYLPKAVKKVVEDVIGLDDRPVPAKHWGADPPTTSGVTPMQVAGLYDLPSGNGTGQTIGIFEMPTNEGNPGYAIKDISATLKLFGGGLKVPSLTAVSVDGQTNTGVSDGETLLDITVSTAVAPGAKIAIYFTAAAGTQNIIHALQRMIHPGPKDPKPTILSISYGWGPDNDSINIHPNEYSQMSQLFQDAARLNITVLVSSGDSGAMFSPNTTNAEASYPATDPWVTACGGTVIGDINGSNFDEYIWNDTWPHGGSGATGGGVSARFPIPSYQNGFPIPKQINTGQPGRGTPDIAGNASPVSGYPQSQAGQQSGGGGTSAVAPFYAGMIAVINTNLGLQVGFLNPSLYSSAKQVFRNVSSPPGPANNSYKKVTGYPASPGWNACTGLGSLNGTALQQKLK